jgi:hypothetical protein
MHSQHPRTIIFLYGQGGGYTKADGTLSDTWEPLACLPSRAGGSRKLIWEEIRREAERRVAEETMKEQWQKHES